MKGWFSGEDGRLHARFIGGMSTLFVVALYIIPQPKLEKIGEGIWHLGHVAAADPQGLVGTSLALATALGIVVSGFRRARALPSPTATSSPRTSTTSDDAP